MTDGVAAGMEEGRRQAYLAALGVPLWSSRHDLPGALPSGGAEFVPFVAEPFAEDVQEIESAVPVSSAVHPEPVEGHPSESRQPVQNALRQAQGERGLPRAPAAKSDVVPPVMAPEPPRQAGPDSHPRFSFRVQRLAPGLLVVIALDDAPDLSAREYRLLENLMQALGADITADTGREHFRWPLSPNPAIPRDAGAAREALSAFLGRRQEAERWLVLGETLAVYVRAALPQRPVVAAPTLGELLESPAAKRRLWQALNG